MSTKIKRIVLTLILIFSLLFISSCSKQKPTVTNYDGKEFDISLMQDKSVLAKTTKVGNDYHLVISGTGEVKSFTSKQNVPWNAISKKITSVTINEGIENIGNYYFYSLTLDHYFIPSSVIEVEEYSFNDSAIIYSHSTSKISTLCANKVYYYSSSKPQVDDEYWHKIGEDIVIWKQYKLLFIGNSFTYYPTDKFSVENPAVCSIIKDIAKSLDIDLLVDFVVRGTYKLSQYASSSDELGKVVEEKLNARSDYDYVILQEHSTTPVNSYNAFNTAVSAIKSKVEKTQQNAQVVLYSTWGYPSAISETSIFSSVSSMEKLLTEAYERCAEENEVKVNYVGKAFTYVYENYPEISLYGSDDKHQTYAGAYLSACVHLASLLNVDVRNVTFNGDLDAKVATKLKEVAHQISLG